MGDPEPAHARCASLAEATLLTTSPLLIRDDADRAAYTRVERQVRLTRYGGDCYAYCALAAGFVDLVIETNLKPHDIVALAPIIEGAGGMVTTWDGENAAKGGRIIAAGDRAVYDEARRLLLAGVAPPSNAIPRGRCGLPPQAARPSEDTTGRANSLPINAIKSQ